MAKVRHNQPIWHFVSGLWGTEELRGPQEVTIYLDPNNPVRYHFVNQRDKSVQVDVMVSRSFWAMIEVRGWGKQQDVNEDLEDDGRLRNDGLSERGDIWFYGPYKTKDFRLDRYGWESHVYFGGLEDARYYTPYIHYYQPPLPGWEGLEHQQGFFA